MENIYMDEKWKLSKKGSRNYSRSKREQGTASSSSCYSGGASTSSSSSGAGGGSHLKRSSSMPESVKAARRPSSGSGSGSSPRSFSSRCANLVKEQRAKFYIVRRCVTMLMCWRDYP